MEKVRSKLIRKRGYPKEISGDTLSLYLSNYPAAAKWLARRIGDRSKTVVELCCGIGITLENLAPAFKKAIGVDINSQTLESCRENLKKSGVSENITLIQGDIRDKELLKTIKADIVVYDIPYWYPEKYPNYTTETNERINPDLINLIKSIRELITEDIIIFAPPEMGYKYFRSNLGKCEYIKIYINNKHDRNKIFLGQLVQQEGENTLSLSA